MIEYTVKVFEDKTEWYLNGNLHREDGPAVECIDGEKEWWVNGKRHRVGGPAVEWAEGSKFWYLNNQRHREDGPAIERANGRKEWYLNDKLVSEADFNKRTKTKELTVNEIEKILGYKIKVVGE